MAAIAHRRKRETDMTWSQRKPSKADIHHVFARGVGRQIIFEDDRDRRAYIGMLSKYAAENGCSILAWCLMDNHVHILIKADLSDLSNLMNRLNSTYAIVFNKRHDRVGHLFQSRFGSEPVDTDAYLMTVVRYIHRNPEAAHLGTMATYPWSSFREFTGRPGIADVAFVLAVFGGVEPFLEFHALDDPSAPCIDEGRGRRLLDPEAACATANAVIAPARVESVKGMPRNERDAAIAKMRKAHLSVRQIERLTGVSRGVIAKIRDNGRA